MFGKIISKMTRTKMRMRTEKSSPYVLTERAKANVFAKQALAQPMYSNEYQITLLTII